MLNFPNQSRVFDPTRRAVRFWGHDTAMEWSFFVTEDALRRLEPKLAQDEASLLRAFDANRSEILGGLDGDAPARAVIEEQDRLIAEKSGKPALAVKSIRRSRGK
jgi:hypothetical protein